MTLSLQGLGVSRGVASGKVHLLEHNELDINEYLLLSHEVEAEVSRFTHALSIARQQLRDIRQRIPSKTPEDILSFIDTHLLMLDDVALTDETIRIIRHRHCNAEWALKLRRDALVAVFDEMEDPYLRTRKDDVEHVVQRIQRILQNQGLLRHEVPDSRLRGYVIAADDLTPADAVMMQHHGIAAFITEFGGPTSHTAILARSVGIPGIVGVHDIRRYLKEDDFVIVDEKHGVVLVDPDQLTIEHYRRRHEEDRQYYEALIKLKETPAETLDNVPVGLYANIELSSDFVLVEKVGAQGIGMFRTESLFMNRETGPDEAEHFKVYSEVVQGLAPLPVTLRTFDLGADKQLPGDRRESVHAASNPALGLRAVRLCLKEQSSLFKPQLRAILRASSLGSVRLLIPMLTSAQEIQQVMTLLDEVRTELRTEGIPFDPKMPVGAMIEVPAAALIAEAFAQRFDFLAIGTNDLIQYTLAIDRVNDEVNYLYEPVHPAVLRLIHLVTEAGRKHDTAVSMCGEMAGDVQFAPLLLALGVREFSVHPALLLEVKRVINSSRLNTLTTLAERALACSSGEEVTRLLREVEQT